MMRRLLLLVCLFTTLALGSFAETARGVVYHDKNVNATLDQGEKGVRGVLVSNGREVVSTDRAGRYEIEVAEDDFIFVLKPTGWMTPVTEDQIPRFWYAHQPSGSPEHLVHGGFEPTGPLPESIDFPLVKSKESRRFEALIFGDTQPRNQREIDFISRDVVAELVGSDAAFGTVLGDVSFDRVDLFGAINRAIAPIGIPFYYVIGNHDIDFHGKDDKDSDEVFESVYGPRYYAFEHGGVHFLNLDSVHWTGERYYGAFGEEQLTFVRNYLATVPKDRLVVALMHIPLMSVEDRQEFLGMLSAYPHTVSFSAHWHNHGHYFLGSEDGWTREEPHHHVVTVTACGGWWTGNLDEEGIPHATMSDGMPNGYLVATFDKNAYTFRFKAARRPDTHQMTIFAPDEVKGSEVAATEVVANVFNGTERSVVEMRVGGAWLPMTQTPRECPLYVQMKERESWLAESVLLPAHKGEGDFNRNQVPGILENLGLGLPKASETSHIWSSSLPEGLTTGLHLIEVRTTDMFGQTYEDRRAIRVIE
jgi:hypothetical protein